MTMCCGARKVEDCSHSVSSGFDSQADVRETFTVELTAVLRESKC